MTYQDLVAKVKSVFEKADAHEITEHVAVQINVEGEAEGIFYLEVADGSVKVEPYDYRDRDLLIITSAATLVEIAEGRITGVEAAESGRLRAEGNFEKAGLLRVIDIQKAEPVEEESVAESEEKTEEPPKAEEPAASERAEEVEEEKPVTESTETVEEVKEEEPVAESTETVEEVEEEKADEPPKAEQTAKTPGGRQISKKKRKKWKKKKTY